MSFIQFSQFQKIADAYPDSIAIETGAGEFSYRQLLTDVEYLSSAISNVAASPADFVGLNMDASYEYIASLLAVNKLKKIFVPMGSAYPVKRIEHIIQKTNMRVLITAQGDNKTVQQLNLQNYQSNDVQCPSGTIFTIHYFSNQDSYVIQQALDDVAYLLSTSGSTGEPKLILGIEKGLDHFIAWQQKRFMIQSGCRGSLLSPVTFDVSLRDILVPLYSGGTVVIPTESTRRDPYALLTWLSEKRINLAHMVPTIFRGLLVELTDQKTTDLSALQYVVLPGEPLYQKDVAKWESLVGQHTQLVISYGPSETSVAKLFYFVEYGKDYIDGIIPLGELLPDTRISILDKNGKQVEPGEVGELCIHTHLLSRGYLSLPEKQAEVFLGVGTDNARYLTGDLVFQAGDGLVYFKGRKDHQVKLRGQRIELLEVESVLKNVANITHAVAVVKADQQGEEKLVVYLGGVDEKHLPVDKIRELMHGHVPDYMLPSVIIYLDSLPTNANGKIDRQQLPDLLKQRPYLTQQYVAPVTDLQKELVSIWQNILSLDGIGVRDNFFDLGGTSNQVLLMLSALRKRLSIEVTVGQAFECGTIENLSKLIQDKSSKPAVSSRRNKQLVQSDQKDIAIVGMALNVPGANTLADFWQNLLDGKESITFFDNVHSSVPDNVRDQPNYIAARGILENAWCFDADFFGVSKREAEVLDPQQRILLQLSYQALQDACVVSDQYEGLIGVFAGVGDNSYYSKVLLNNEEALLLGDQALRLANEKDYVATRIAHMLNLKGMAISVHTACSTSLVAVCQAVEALRRGSIDAALCGGAYMPYPQESGHLYAEGGFASKDGHCRPFDAQASGTLFSSGAGMVLLKRLSDAVADGDHIYATIKGVGVNNDGGGKMSFMSPSADGQAQAIQMAVDDADIAADSIDYIEAHGTATPLGDPIEVEALSRVYKPAKDEVCLLGSVKSNIGHLDAAAGVVGLIKSALSLQQNTLPASINYQTPNPAIPFDDYRFKVNTQSFSPEKALKHIAVSSFGVGGTNAHAILEVASSSAESLPEKMIPAPELILLSAKSAYSLTAIEQSFIDFMRSNDNIALAQVTANLALHREHHAHRSFAVCENIDSAIHALQERSLTVYSDNIVESVAPKKVAFLFPGQGSQHVGMGECFYGQEVVYTQAFDHCAELLSDHVDWNLREIVYPTSEHSQQAANELIQRTEYAQPALFSVCYAMAKLWQSLGVTPDIMAGHSIGEYVAACLAGIFNLDDAIKIVVARGRLMQSMDAGDMLSVSLSESDIQPYLNDRLSIAAVNANNLTVVAGDADSIAVLKAELDKSNIDAKLLMTSHAFHSHMMEPMLDEFARCLQTIHLHSAEINIVSTATANFLTEPESVDINYWVSHVRKPVRFYEAVQTLWSDDDYICLELGPRATATTLANQVVSDPIKQLAISSQGKSTQLADVRKSFIFAVGQLWAAGVELDWQAWYRDKVVNKVSLPTYQFALSEYRLDGISTKTAASQTAHTYTENAISEQLVKLISQFTGAQEDSIALDKNFVALGLDSLSLTQFSLSLQKMFSKQIPVSRLLTNCATPAQLTEYILHDVQKAEELMEPDIQNHVFDDVDVVDVDDMSQQNMRLGMDEKGNPQWYKRQPDQEGNYYQYKETNDKSSLLQVSYDPFRKGGIENVVPMTQSQSEIWLSAQQDEDASKAFNLSLCLSFSGELQVDLLTRALHIMVARHEALRSTFSADKLAMVIYADIDIQFEQVTLKGRTKDECLQQLQHEEERLCDQAFDLTNGPLFRACLFKLDDTNHFLTFVAHHMIVDGWSLDLFISEIEGIYNSLSQQQSIGLPEAYSIAKYNSASISKRLEQAYINAEQYWVEQYKDSVLVLDLPVYKKRPVFRTYKADRCEHQLSQYTVEVMNEALSKCDTTFFAFAYSIYVLLLHKLTKQDDIAVGVPYAGQIATGNKHLFGHCVNMLPIRLSVDKTLQVKDFVQYVQKQLFTAQDNGLLTFSDLIGKVNIPRDTSRIPIISTTFNIDEGNRQPQFANLDTTYEYHSRKYETFELATTIIRNGGHNKIQCQYNTGLFARQQIENWLAIYEQLIQSVCQSLKQPLAGLNVLPQTDIEQFRKWNNTQFDYDKSTCLGDFVAQAAHKYPNKTAVVFEGVSYTYKELDDKSNQLANYFIELGVKPDEFIGLYIERSVDTLLVLLAVLKSGSGYLPLDPEYPLDRITFILSDAKAKVLITQEKFVNNIASFEGDIICLEALEDLANAQPSSKPVTALKSHNMAYTIYTSGSTGKPKGVQVTHQNVVNFLLSMAKEPGLEHNDKLLAVTTISFDIHVLEMYLPLVCGATIEIASRDLAIDGEGLINCLSQSGITVMQATPSTWRMMLEAGWDSRHKIKALVGGEALPKDILPKFIQNTTELWNMYGPTETTVWSTCYHVTDPDATILVGKPIANTQLYILDEQMQAVPLGTSGELYIGGDGVTNGYLYRPELTAERFIADPFSTEACLYRTGDEVRFQLDGNVEYINRIDNQVKVRGYRIELGEIESVLSKYSDINQVVVIVREDTPGDARLVAYYSLLSGDEKLEHQALKAFMSKDLPPYMVPHHFVLLDTFPLTPNGKVDKKQLPIPVVDTDDKQSDYIMPEGEVEQKIALIWSDLLGVKNIGLFDNFFEIGGHSLLAIKFIVRIKEEFGVKLNFQNVILDSLQNIAQLCGSTQYAATQVQHVNDQRLPVKTAYFGENSALYGIYHPASDKNKRHESVLICPPVSQDYVRSYRLLKMLSEQLAKQGYDVLRFDYYGTGDSLGMDYETSCSRWKEDIQTAFDYLQSKNKQPVSTFAARLGATLVSNLSNIDFNKVLLWDPVISGKLHIDALTSLQKDMVNDMSNYRWGRRTTNTSGCFQFTAFNYSGDNIAQIKDLSFDTRIKADAALIWSADMENKDFNATFKDSDIHKLKLPGSWYDFMRQEDVLTSPEIVKLAVKIFEEKQ